MGRTRTVYRCTDCGSAAPKWAGRCAGCEAWNTLVWLLWLVADTALPHILGHLDDVKPTVLAIDSVQTIYDPSLSSAPGSVAQVRECTHKLVREAKDRGIATVLVGHVTKDGGLA